MPEPKKSSLKFKFCKILSHPKSVLFLTSEIRNRDSHSGCSIFYPSTGKNTSCIGQCVSFLLLFKVAPFKFFSKINYSGQIVPTVRDFQEKLIDIDTGGGTLNCDIWLSLMRDPLYSNFGKICSPFPVEIFTSKNWVDQYFHRNCIYCFHYIL